MEFTFEEKVQARMAAIRYQKEQDAIEKEARTRLNAEKRLAKHRRKNEKENAEKMSAFAQLVQQVEDEKKKKEQLDEKERQVRITGMNARIRRIEHDIDQEVYTYKRIMMYKDCMPEQEREYFNQILENIKKTHDEYKALLTRKMIERHEFINGK
jgi:hypothetical protein